MSSKHIDKKEQYVRLLDGSGTAINSTSGCLCVTLAAGVGQALESTQLNVLSKVTDIETNTDVLTITGGGVEASALRVTLASDSTGVLSVDDNGGSLTVDAVALDVRALTNADVVTAELSATDNAVLDQIELNTDSLAVVGGGVEASALRVTLANDSTGVLTVDAVALDIRALTNADVVSSEQTVRPVVAGSAGNLWNAATPGLGAASSSVDLRYCSKVMITGQAVSDTNTLDVQVSLDDSTWYNSGHQIVLAAGVDFCVQMDLGMRYLRLRNPGGAFAGAITAQVAGKS